MRSDQIRRRLTLLSHGESRSDPSSRALVFARASDMAINAVNNKKMLQIEGMERTLAIFRHKQNLRSAFFDVLLVKRVRTDGSIVADCMQYQYTSR